MQKALESLLKRIEKQKVRMKHGPKRQCLEAAEQEFREALALLNDFDQPREPIHARIARGLALLCEAGFFSQLDEK